MFSIVLILFLMSTVKQYHLTFILTADSYPSFQMSTAVMLIVFILIVLLIVLKLIVLDSYCPFTYISM